MLTEGQVMVVKEFLKDLCNDKYDNFYVSDYDNAIFHSTDPSDYTEWVYLEAKHKCTIYTGLTKMVVHFCGFPCVIKIPFHGVYNPYEKIIATTFDDHCAIEIQTFNRLEDDMKQLLLPVEFEFAIGNIKIYSQLTIDETYDDFIYNYCEDNEDYMDSDCDYTMNMRGSSAVHRFGNKFIESVALNFCCGDYQEGAALMYDIGGEITDLHKENYGFKDNKPVIFDYAGISESGNAARIPF